MKVIKLIVIFFVTPFFIFAQDFNSNEQVEIYLQHHLSELNLSKDDISDYHIYREYYSEKTSLTHVFLQQQYQGISIHKAEIRLHFHKDKSWIITQNTFVKDLNSLNNPFPTVFDIPPYVKKFSFFDLTPVLLDSCIMCANNKGNFTFTMRATNCNWDMLHLHIYKDGPNTCTISQPEFEIMKPF